ncbi:MAG: FtsQ-type POTRA domain-containing protein [Armatimonadetes bacterium]|nr:FtsQ-type POTRA domain-containing protein [Armatimonadota bacterium]
MATTYDTYRRAPRGASASAVRRQIRRFLLPSAFVVLVPAVIGFLGSDALALRLVRVSSRDAPLEKEVCEYLSVPERANTLFFPTRSLAEQALRCPRVKSVRVDRELPHAIVVHVEPRNPAFALTSGSNYVMVDEEGVLLFQTHAPGKQYPRVDDRSSVPRILGGRLNQQCLATVLACMDGARQAGMKPGFVLDLGTAYDYRMLTPDKTPVLLGGPDNMVRKVIIAASTEQHLRKRGARAEYIDVTVVTNPRYKLAERDRRAQ